MSHSTKLVSSFFLVLLFLYLPSFASYDKLSDFLKTQKETILISKSFLLDRNLSLTKPVLVTQNGCITQGGRYKLEISASFSAPIKQVFKGFLPNEVVFSPHSVKEVYPQWWGAKGNGIEDDYIPLQSAIDSACQTIFLLKGRYRFTKPLNVTNRPHGLNLIGQGQSENGSILIGDTGGIAVDASGSRYLHFANFAIVAGDENPSTVGILFSRTKKVGFVEFNNIENVRVQMRSDGKANNRNGTVAIYNNAGELWRARNIYLIADNPLVFTGYNIFRIDSPFTKREEAYVSMSECTVDGASTLHAFLGPAITVDNGDTIEVINAYLTRSGEGGFPYAIKVAGFWALNLTYTGHIEGFSRFLYTDVSNLVGCYFRATLYQNGEPLIYLEGNKERPSLLSCEINLIPEPTSKPSCLIYGKGKVAVNHNRIWVYMGQSVECAEGEFLGNIVQAIDEKPSIKVNQNNCSYLLISPRESKWIGSAQMSK
ncbi:MAG: hypothetical protein ACP5KZ_06820 [bacterium]